MRTGALVTLLIAVGALAFALFTRMWFTSSRGGYVTSYGLTGQQTCLKDGGCGRVREYEKPDSFSPDGYKSFYDWAQRTHMIGLAAMAAFLLALGMVLARAEGAMTLLGWGTAAISALTLVAGVMVYSSSPGTKKVSLGVGFIFFLVGCLCGGAGGYLMTRRSGGSLSSADGQAQAGLAAVPCPSCQQPMLYEAETSKHLCPACGVRI